MAIRYVDIAAEDGKAVKSPAPPRPAVDEAPAPPPVKIKRKRR